MADETTIVFYSVLVAVFIIAIVLVVMWFMRSTNKMVENSQNGGLTPMTPRTRQSLDHLCSIRRDIERVL